MTTVVHFEVYVYDDARGWLLQSRYPGDERLQAIEEAKMMEFSLNRAVRVVRETYYPQTNFSEETVTYIGRIKPRQKPLPPAVGGIEVRGGDSDLFRDYGNGSSKGPKTTADFAFRLIVVMIASLAVAILGTGILSLIGQNLFLTLGLTDTTQSVLLFLMFMGLFLMVAVPLTMLYVPVDRLFVPRGAAPSAPARKEKRSAEASEPERKTNTTPEEQVEAAVAAQAADNAIHPGAETDPDATPAAEGEEDAKAKDKAKTKAQKEAEAEALKKAKEEADAAAKALKEAQGETDAAGDDEEGSLALESSRLVMMKFLGGAVSAIKTVRPQLDTYNRFGINLYLTGACDALAEAKGLNPDERAILVREAVEVIGTRTEHANQLIDRLDTYKRQSRYRQMIAAGKVAMEVHLAGSSDPFIAIGGVIKDWNTPQAQQVASSTVTILFTDMVGSTDMTHLIGDAAAQDVIRAHNHIVRSALARFQGKEVKHTGDGIMASFDKAGDAVRAAMEIQRKAAEHTERWPQQVLDLRIGMNTGEPIIEENDYFGATVQLAARVCAVAGAGQVWLSEDTFGALDEPLKDDVFDQGRQQLKGVQGETKLFEVAWNEARRVALEAAQEERATAARAAVDAAAGQDDTGDDQVTDDGAEETTPGEVVDAAGPMPASAPAAKAKPAPTVTASARPKPNLQNLPPAPPPRKPRPGQKRAPRP